MNDRFIPTHDDELITVPEAAKYLRISRAQAYVLAKRKELPVIKISQRRYVVSVRELKKMLEEKKYGR